MPGPKPKRTKTAHPAPSKPPRKPTPSAPDSKRRTGDHLVKKGQVLNPNGRPKGKPNKVTVDVRDMIQRATDAAGVLTVAQKLYDTGQYPDMEAAVAQAKAEGAKAIDYLTEQAMVNPKSFLALYGKIVPQKVDLEVSMMTQELVERMQAGRDRIAEAKRNGTIIEGDFEIVED